MAKQDIPFLCIYTLTVIHLANKKRRYQCFAIKLEMELYHYQDMGHALGIDT